MRKIALLAGAAALALCAPARAQTVVVNPTQETHDILSHVMTMAEWWQQFRGMQAQYEQLRYTVGAISGARSLAGAAQDGLREIRGGPGTMWSRVDRIVNGTESRAGASRWRERNAIVEPEGDDPEAHDLRRRMRARENCQAEFSDDLRHSEGLLDSVGRMLSVLQGAPDIHAAMALANAMKGAKQSMDATERKAKRMEALCRQEREVDELRREAEGRAAARRIRMATQHVWDRPW